MQEGERGPGRASSPITRAGVEPVHPAKPVDRGPTRRGRDPVDARPMKRARKKHIYGMSYADFPGEGRRLASTCCNFFSRRRQARGRHRRGLGPRRVGLGLPLRGMKLARPPARDGARRAPRPALPFLHFPDGKRDARPAARRRDPARRFRQNRRRAGARARRLRAARTSRAARLRLGSTVDTSAPRGRRGGRRGQLRARPPAGTGARPELRAGLLERRVIPYICPSCEAQRGAPRTPSKVPSSTRRGATELDQLPRAARQRAHCPGSFSRGRPRPAGPRGSYRPCAPARGADVVHMMRHAVPARSAGARAAPGGPARALHDDLDTFERNVRDQLARMLSAGLRPDTRHRGHHGEPLAARLRVPVQLAWDPFWIDGGPLPCVQARSRSAASPSPTLMPRPTRTPTRRSTRPRAVGELLRAPGEVKVRKALDRSASSWSSTRTARSGRCSAGGVVPARCRRRACGYVRLWRARAGGRGVARRIEIDRSRLLGPKDALDGNGRAPLGWRPSGASRSSRSDRLRLAPSKWLISGPSAAIGPPPGHSRWP